MSTLIRSAALLLSCGMSSTVLAAENNGYPTEIVKLKAGMIACETLEDVEQSFANWVVSFKTRGPEQLPTTCLHISDGFRALMEYVGPFENSYWKADLLKYIIFHEEAPGISVMVGIYYGYGSAKMKEGALNQVEASTQL